MIIRSLLTGLVLAVFASLAAACQSDPDGRLADVRAMMTEAYGGDAPGGAVMVMEGGEVLLAEGYGLADLEWRQSATHETSFRVGSVSKVIAAVTILRQVEAGQLDLDAPASTYLPDLPGVLGQPTIRQLLAHTSGLPEHFALPRMQEIMRNPITFDALVALMADAELMFEPGTRWAYSNFNYVLLSGIAEAVDPAGRDFGAIVEEDVFAPLGMTNSHYDRQSAVIPRRARGYDHDGAGPVNTTVFDTSTVRAAGAIMLSAEDYGLFSAALRDGHLLSDEMRQEAWRETVLPDGSPTGYGLGFNVSEFLDETVIWHSGSINGFQSTWIHMPDSDRTVAVMSNGYYRPNTTMMARRILAGLAGITVPEMRVQTFVAADWPSLEGRYALDDGRLLQIHVQDGVRFNLDGGGWDELAWGGGDLFFLPDTLYHFTLDRDPQGAITGLSYVDGVLERYTGSRQAGEIEGAQHAVALDAQRAEAHAGDWQIPTGDPVLVRFDGEVLTLQLPGQPPRRLHAAEDGSYFCRDVPLNVRFGDDPSRASFDIYGYPYEMSRN